MNRTCRAGFLILVALTLAAVAPSAAGARFRALLVGIDYKGADPDIRQLCGAVNDATDMYSLMTGPLGISPDGIRILTEKQATRAAILSDFREWLVDGTRPGDMVFFQFSGHGTTTPDPFGTQLTDPVKQGDPENQKMAEAMVCFDTELDRTTKSITNLIYDTEIHRLLQKLDGRQVTLFLDFCHSGGATRDFQGEPPATRFLQPPWDLRETHTEPRPERREAGFRGIIRGTRDPEWRPPFTLLAAVKYFQEAYEYPIYCGHHGAFTYPVLKLLRANPGARFTNRDVFSYATSFIRDVAGIKPKEQSPVFRGPPGAGDRPFVLLAASAGAAPPTPPEVPEPGGMGVRITGPRSALRSKIESAIRRADFIEISQNRPDTIVGVTAGRIDIHHAGGRLAGRVPDGPDAVSRVLKTLEGLYIVRELAALENPAAPFAVDLWIDEPGKRRFSTRDRVTFHYRVDRIPGDGKAWFTLINVAPDGSVSILYPQKSDFYTGPGEKRFLNAPIESGVVHSIPKAGTDLPDGRNVAADLRIQLSQGQEYFKAIVTAEPVDWENLGLNEFRSRFTGSEGRRFAESMTRGIKRRKFWATGALRVSVE